MSEKINTQVELESVWGVTDYFTNEKNGGKETYKGRPLIGMDTRIAGGVYFGAYGGEAIVVDPEKYPDEYNRLLQDCIERATVDGCVSRSRILGAVFDTVKEAMPYSISGVQTVLDMITINQGKTEFASGTKVDLSSFIKQHAGVCRHQALAAGVLLEHFKDEGYIRGDVSVDRNIAWDANADEKIPGGHVWVRYTSHNKVFILDVAQNYLGTLEDSVSKANWNYLRPDEKDGYAAIGKAALNIIQ